MHKSCDPRKTYLLWTEVLYQKYMKIKDSVLAYDPKENKFYVD